MWNIANIIWSLQGSDLNRARRYKLIKSWKFGKFKIEKDFKFKIIKLISKNK